MSQTGQLTSLLARHVSGFPGQKGTRLVPLLCPEREKKSKCVKVGWTRGEDKTSKGQAMMEKPWQLSRPELHKHLSPAIALTVRSLHSAPVTPHFQGTRSAVFKATTYSVPLRGVWEDATAWAVSPPRPRVLMVCPVQG